jgi:cell division protein FtsW
MLLSASCTRALSATNDPQYYLKRQLLWLSLGSVSAAICAALPYRIWRKVAVPVAVLALVLLGLVLVPGIGTLIGGSRRWLRFGNWSLQPSEFGKFASVLFIAWWMCRRQRNVERFFEGFLYPVLGLLAFALLVLMEPDVGTAALIGLTGIVLMFAGGTRWTYLLILCVGGTLALYGAYVGIQHSSDLMANPKIRNRINRIEGFFNPTNHPGISYQANEAKAAFAMGGLWGRGLGESLQKRAYLPEAHTDFILPIIGEELGLRATAAVVLLFLGYLACGCAIAFGAADFFGRLLGFGITLLTTLQAIINIGVVTESLPNKGLPLPFISYGGSSLLFSLIGVGILLSIARRSEMQEEGKGNSAIRDQTHWV